VRRPRCLLLTLVPALIAIVVTFLLAGGAVWTRSLTAPAGIVAGVFGSVIVVLAGYPFLALLILFVVGSVLATRYRIEEKRRQNVQEGKSGERGVSNVMAHIVLPTALVVGVSAFPSLLPVPDLALLYTCALAFGASDTFASEFGVLAGHARSILSLRPVTPGTNGGVSGMGEAFALLGAGSTAAIGLGLFAIWGPWPGNAVGFFLTATVAGFLACQVDSVLGEVLENRGYLTKGGTNFLGMLFAIVVGALVVLAGVAVA
jgi:uncharacterized protein (TIGR00297 family)